MPDFLGRLAERLLVPPSPVLPVVAPRFSPASTGPAAETPAEDTQATAPRLPQSSPAPVHQTRQTAPPPPDRFSQPASPRAAPDPVRPRTEQTGAVAPSLDDLTRAAADAVMQQLHSRVKPDSANRSAGPQPEPAAEISVRPERITASQISPPRPTLPPPVFRAPPAETLAPTESPHPAARREAPTPPAVRPIPISPRTDNVVEPPPPRPTVQITIGRLEVRAAPSPAPPPPRPAPPEPRPMGLAEYLSRRSGGS